MDYIRKLFQIPLSSIQLSEIEKNKEYSNDDLFEILQYRDVSLHTGKAIILSLIKRLNGRIDVLEKKICYLESKPLGKDPYFNNEGIG